jgi:hypothetical protein
MEIKAMGLDLIIRHTLFTLKLRHLNLQALNYSAELQK